MRLGLNIGLTRRAGGGGAPDPLLAGAIFSQPLVGEAVDTVPASGGTGTLTYQWYRGDPAGSGVAISGATSEGYTPVEADYGETLYRRVTDGAETTSDMAAADVVGQTFEETWESSALGTDYPLFLTPPYSYDLINIEVVTNANSATGRALAWGPATSSPRRIHRNDIETFMAANEGDTQYTEMLYIFEMRSEFARIYLRVNDPDSSYLGIGCGLTIRLNTFFHAIYTDPNNSSGPGLRVISMGDIIAVRHRIEGDTSYLWIWSMDEAEPADPTSVLQHTGPLRNLAPHIGARAGATPGADLYYMSVGCNAPAPLDERFPMIPVSSADVMEFAAAAESGAQVTMIVDNDIEFVVEDL